MIHLHLDCAVDPSKEQEMLRYFADVFQPAARKFPGFIDVRMLKLRSVLAGKAPAGINYRFWIAYESEELRQKWIASQIHVEVWGQMEKMLSSPNYDVLLFDVMK
jgi:heme-degrading monooxygenase HmoA